MSATGGGHVSFSEGTHLDTDVVKVEEGSAFQLPEAHIGLLKNHHTYNAEFFISHELGKDVTVSEPNYNLYVRTLEYAQSEPDPDREGRFRVSVKVQVKTIKEGRIREKLIVSSPEDDKKQMEVLITAVVMGTNQGNPLLKDGVHMVSHEVEDESEWPGHSSH